MNCFHEPPHPYGHQVNLSHMWEFSSLSRVMHNSWAGVCLAPGREEGNIFSSASLATMVPTEVASLLPGSPLAEPGIVMIQTLQGCFGSNEWMSNP